MTILALFTSYVIIMTIILSAMTLTATLKGAL